MHELINAENIVSVGLVVSLVLAIFYGSNELSMSIASGLIGYIGRGKLERKDDVKLRYLLIPAMRWAEIRIPEHAETACESATSL